MTVRLRIFVWRLPNIWGQCIVRILMCFLNCVHGSTLRIRCNLEMLGCCFSICPSWVRSFILLFRLRLKYWPSGLLVLSSSKYTGSPNLFKQLSRHFVLINQDCFQFISATIPLSSSTHWLFYTRPSWIPFHRVTASFAPTTWTSCSRPRLLRWQSCHLSTSPAHLLLSLLFLRLRLMPSPSSLGYSWLDAALYCPTFRCKRSCPFPPIFRRSNWRIQLTFLTLVWNSFVLPTFPTFPILGLLFALSSQSTV